MALKRLENGTYVVKTRKHAIDALEGMRNLEAEIRAVMEEHGITEMMEDATEMKKAATAWAVANEIEQIELDGAHATLISQGYDKGYVATKDDLPTAPEMDHKVIPMRTILKKKFKKDPAKYKEVWNRITKRVVDRESVDEVVSEGILTVDEIAPSFVERKKSPYLKLFEDKS